MYKTKSHKWVLYGLIFAIPIVLFAAATASSSGDWDDTGIWASSNIGDSGETVTFDNNIGEIIIRQGFTYTVGAMDMQQGNTLTVNGILNVGDASNADDLTTGNTTTISVGPLGSLTIWGDLNAGNNLTIGLGTLTIKGNLIMDNNTTMTITGDVQIDGNFIAGNNADVTIPSGGSLIVDGFYDVGNGSKMSGSGTAIGDPCSGPDEFCLNSPLPVDLVFFKLTPFSDKVEIAWETASELNNSYFDVMRSENGKDFYKITRLNGNGTSNQPNSYSFMDAAPIALLEFYRLKQVDFDGTVKDYPIRVVSIKNIDGQIQISTYPNPTSNKVTFSASRPIAYKRLELFNSSGQMITNLKNSIRGNGFRTEIELPQLNSGFYYIKYVTSNGNSGSQKIVVR